MTLGLSTAIAARGRWLLVAGLGVGLMSPDAALALRPFVGPLVVALLFLAVLRIGPDGLRMTRSALVAALGRVALWQLVVPFGVALALAAAGLLGHPLALTTVLILSAAPITGAAHIAVMSGGEPAPALRQAVLGTALLPLTVLPVFVLVPAFGDAAAVVSAVLRLLAVIGVAGGAALLVRTTGLVTERAAPRIDAVAAVLLAIVVIGLMSGAAQTLRAAPLTLALVLALSCLLCFGLQAAALRSTSDPALRLPLAVTAGNRNAALFLTALPPEVIKDLLLMIGCYQVPMYLTPLVLPWLGRRS